MTIQRYKLIVAYDGSGFHGWQEQRPPDSEPLRTVQGVLRHALVQVMRQPIELTGASRTDTGVHAAGQVAHFDGETRIPTDRVAAAINSRLPDDVEVLRAEVVNPDFDAIRDAKCKEYRYRIWTAPQRPLWRRHFVWHWWTPLNIEAMQDAAARLKGRHDFAGFANADHGRLSTEREILDCRVEQPANSPNEVHVVVSGNGFLYNMVRIIVGTLVEIGRGHWQPDRVDMILAACDRSIAGPTAPPQGLCLQWIRYE